MLILIFVLGSCLGSFLSVLINRTLQNKKGIIKGHSECPNCHHRLHSLDLIPIFSWLLKLGKCSYCHKPISFQYPALELCSGILALTSFMFMAENQFNFADLNYGTPLFWLKTIYLILINTILLAIAFSDLKNHQIPNLFLIFWILLALPAIFLISGLNLISIIIALLINLVFFGGQHFLSKGRWLGSGDIFISIGMALLLGWQKNLVAIVTAYVIGSIISIILIAAKKAQQNSQIAFGPFLVLGTLVALYFGNEIIMCYLSFNAF